LDQTEEKSALKISGARVLREEEREGEDWRLALPLAFLLEERGVAVLRGGVAVLRGGVALLLGVELLLGVALLLRFADASTADDATSTAT
jgi:hypothetical protein